MIHSDIRQKIASTLRREISVAELERWLDSESRDMFNDGDADAVELVSSVHLLLGDYYDDRLNEAAFRAGLASLLRNAFIHLNVYSDSEPVVRPVSQIISFSNSFQVPSFEWVVRSPA